MIEELTGIAKKVDLILKDELKKAGIKPDFAEARVYDAKSVGVQGDQRTYTHPVEITLFAGGTFMDEHAFLARLSNRITNEVPDINRVVYLIGAGKTDAC